jgi:hypothetical protein
MAISNQSLEESTLSPRLWRSFLLYLRPNAVVASWALPANSFKSRAKVGRKIGGRPAGFRRAPLFSGQPAYKPGSGRHAKGFACVTAIPLGRRSPGASSNLPGRQDPDTSRSGAFAPTSRRPYSVLLPVGFALPPALLPTRCALTAPFDPYRSEVSLPRRYVFCGTVPRFAPAGCYPAPFVRGARTFLSGNLSVLPERPSDRLTPTGMGILRKAVKGRGRPIAPQA